MATTSERLREIISIRNIKQVDLQEKTGISKGALSSYISGRYVPKQDKIYKLAKALDVNPAWLMGLDVPMEIESTKSDLIVEMYKHLPSDVLENSETLDEASKIIIEYQELPADKKNQFLAYLRFLKSES